MNNPSKTLFGCLFFGGLLIAVTVKFYNKDININLSQVDHIYGVVLECGVTEKRSKNFTNNVFYIKLDNATQHFATYRPKQNYSHLIEQIKPGDTISIYYKGQQDNDLNLDVYQIEKKGRVLQDYQSYNQNFKILSYLTGILGIGLFIFGIWNYYRKT